MEPCLSYKVKPLLLCFLMLSLLVVHLASAVPTSRSMQLRNLHSSASFEAFSYAGCHEMVAALGKVQLQAKATTSMDAEVNDYPSPGANNRHHPPKGPEVNDYPSPGANNRHHPPKGLEVNDYPSPGANNRHHPPKGPEVNDYPSPGANNRHHPPKGPGRG